MGTGADQVGADMQAVKEAGAGRVDIQRCCITGAQGIGYQGSGIGTQRVIGEAAQQDKI